MLARWNYYRASAGVPPIVADPELNLAAEHHAKYLVENHIEAGDGTVKDGVSSRPDGISARTPNRSAISGTPRTARSGPTTPMSFAAWGFPLMELHWLMSRPRVAIR